MTFSVECNKSLVFSQVSLGSKEEVIELLAHALQTEGFVKEGFKEAITKREGEYPTGLPSEMPMVAIPHADYELVNKTAIAVAVLQEPVFFNNMESNSEELPVQIVIMMAIAEPHGQIEMLQRIIGFIQDKVAKEKLLECQNKENILTILEETILKGEVK